MQGFLAELKRRNVIRVATAYLLACWLILQMIDVVFPFFELPDTLGKPILITLIIGFPVAVFLAWIFELTPDGIVQEKNLDRSKFQNSLGSPWLDKAIKITLLFAVALLLVDKFVLNSNSATDNGANDFEVRHSVAVLPFANMSGKAENEYFSDGMTETLLHLLAQIPDLKVAARTSAFAFKGKNIDIREIAESLGVSHVLEGSVQRSGDRVRITAQLIEAENGYHVWSETYDRDVEDIFVVQDEIAGSVAEALQLQIMGVAANDKSTPIGIGTKDTGAYEKYLKALEQKNIGSYGSLPRAEGLFKEVLVLDPNFLEAKLDLAATYQMQAETGILSTERSEIRIEPLLEQVLEQAPDNVRARGIMATLNFQKTFREFGPGSPEVAAAGQALRTVAEQAATDPSLFIAMANVEQIAGLDEEALAWLNRGLAIDPMSASLYWRRGSVLLNDLDRPVEAEMSFAMGRELAPEWTAVYFGSGNVAFSEGNYGDGIAWWYQALELDPQDHELPASIAAFFYQFGLTDEAEGMRARAQSIAPQEPFSRSIALQSQIYANNHERVVTLAEQMLRDGLDNERGGAFTIALAGYVNSMMELGRSSAITPVFESIYPGISSADYKITGPSDFTMRFFQVLVWANAGDFDAVNSVIDSLFEYADRGVPGWRDDNYAMVNVSLALGDHEAAVDYAIKDLSQPYSKIRNWQFGYRKAAWLSSVTKDERVAPLLQELEQETRRAADEVRAMLASMQEELG